MFVDLNFRCRYADVCWLIISWQFITMGYVGDLGVSLAALSSFFVQLFVSLVLFNTQNIIIVSEMVKGLNFYPM